MHSARRSPPACRARSRRPEDASDDHALVILILGDGAITDTMPDPGDHGFAIQPLFLGSVSVTDEDGLLWIEGDAAAIRGTPPPGARGHLRVIPVNSSPDDWLARPWLQLRAARGAP